MLETISSAHIEASHSSRVRPCRHSAHSKRWIPPRAHLPPAVGCAGRGDWVRRGRFEFEASRHINTLPRLAPPHRVHLPHHHPATRSLHHLTCLAPPRRVHLYTHILGWSLTIKYFTQTCVHCDVGCINASLRVPDGSYGPYSHGCYVWGACNTIPSARARSRPRFTSSGDTEKKEAIGASARAYETQIPMFEHP